MAHGDELADDSRTTRVKLLGTVLALVQLKNGDRVRAKLQQLSTNGGVLQIPEPQTKIKIFIYIPGLNRRL